MLLFVNGQMLTITGPEAIDAIRERERAEGFLPIPILLSSERVGRADLDCR